MHYVIQFELRTSLSQFHSHRGRPPRPPLPTCHSTNYTRSFTWSCWTTDDRCDRSRAPIFFCADSFMCIMFKIYLAGISSGIQGKFKKKTTHFLRRAWPSHGHPACVARHSGKFEMQCVFFLCVGWHRSEFNLYLAQSLRCALHSKHAVRIEASVTLVDKHVPVSACSGSVCVCGPTAQTPANLYPFH